MPECFKNPFRPGAGHPPPYLAGRENETNEFLRLIEQPIVLDNLVLTGLRGTGKTVLLESFKPLAIKNKWLWAGTDLSESASISEKNLVQRILADLSMVTSSIVIEHRVEQGIGFTSSTDIEPVKLGFNLLEHLYNDTPGLVSDKLKFVLEFSWKLLSSEGFKGVVFAYDEAQNLADQDSKEEYPLSILLDVFQSLQRKGFPFLLILTGLPTLFPKLVKARTYSERMFHIIELGKLDKEASHDAIVKPIQKDGCSVKLTSDSVEKIINLSGGYPYFIQFICKEVYDAFLQKDDGNFTVPVDEIMKKLDADFFIARWARATDRQRELLTIIARLENSASEFTVKDIVEISSTLHFSNPFKSSGVNQMLNSLSISGLVFKNRHGKYSFAVPLMGGFILREVGEEFNFDN